MQMLSGLLLLPRWLRWLHISRAAVCAVPVASGVLDLVLPVGAVLVLSVLAGGEQHGHPSGPRGRAG
jgi:hypothetical protein